MYVEMVRACGELDKQWKDGKQQDAHEYLRSILSVFVSIPLVPVQRAGQPLPLCMTDTVIAASCSHLHGEGRKHR